MPILDYQKTQNRLELVNYKVDVIFNVNEGFSMRNHKPQDIIISSPIASNKKKKRVGCKLQFPFPQKLTKKKRFPRLAVFSF